MLAEEHCRYSGEKGQVRARGTYEHVLLEDLDWHLPCMVAQATD